MKRSYSVSMFYALCALFIPLSVHAVVNTIDQPHKGVASSYSCTTCHTDHLNLGPVESSAASANNDCQTCHRVGDSAAGAKPIASADAANPFNNQVPNAINKVYQTSHRWDGAIVEPLAGAQLPIQPAFSSVVRRFSGQMSCSICHNQHSNVNGKFLRVNNSADALCMDCHRSRAVSSHEQGSHPVNVPVPSTTAFVMQTANPSNPTSNLSVQLAKSGGQVICSTCHGVHYTDSRSSTFDGFSSAEGRGRNFYNLSTGDGYLLRTDQRGKPVTAGTKDNINICTNCHAGKMNHNYKNQNVQCTDCHGAHVEYDPNDPDGSKWGKNKFLIRRNVSKFGQPQQVLFRYTGSKREYVNTTDTGVCQGCHDVPKPGGVYPIEHSYSDPNVCKNCHAHDNKRGSFAGACNTCHGHPPKTADIGTADGLATPATGATGTPGAHEMHVTQRGMDCSTCHNGYAGRAMPNSTIDMGFTVDSNKFPGFKSSDSRGTYGNSNTLSTATNGQPYVFTGNVDVTGTIAANQTCANVYCHGATLKNSAGVNTGSHINPNWTINDGSQAGCNSCHATIGSGPGTAGHTRHTAIMGCSNCHGATPSVSAFGGWYGPNHVNGVTNWDVSALSARQSGSPQAGYKADNGIYAAIGATNTLSPSAVYGSCANIYCHSNVQGALGTGAPTSFTSPVWSSSTALTCGSCHVDMSSSASATGSHIKHAQSYNIACGSCHTGYTDTSVNTNTHAKNTQFVDVIFPATGITAGSKYNNSNTGNKAAGSGYASCTTSYCHSNSGPNGATRTYPGIAPVWGGAQLGCGSCHLDMATDAVGTGGHKSHASSANVSGPQFGCEVCHAGYASGAVNAATHVDQQVNLNFAASASTTYSKPLASAAGTAWGTCSASKCHGQATSLPWNGSLYSTTETCAKCHSSMTTVTASGQFYSTEYPTKKTVATDVKVGAHLSHLASTNGMSISLACSDCHGSVGLKDASHMNGATNFAWSNLATKNGAYTPVYAAGTCSNTYCHGASMVGGTDKAPVWNSSTYLPAVLTPEACAKCHGFPPQTVSGVHNGIAMPTGFPVTSCGCHPNMRSDVNANTYATIFAVKSIHIDGKVDGGGTCNSCHGYPPANKRFVKGVNNFEFASMENYTGGGGAHTIAGHVPPGANPAQLWVNCTPCHSPNDHSMTPLEFKPSSNIKVRIDPRDRFSPNRTAKYNSNNLDGSAHVSGNCSNISCHFQKSPKW